MDIDGFDAAGPPGLLDTEQVVDDPIVAITGNYTELASNLASSASAKATFANNRKLAAKSPASSSTKATVSIARKLATKCATASSAKATMSVARPLAGKAPASSSVRVSLTVTSPTTTAPAMGGGLGRRGPYYPDRTPEQVLREEDEIMVMI